MNWTVETLNTVVDDDSRVLYVTVHKKRVVVRAFIKKNSKNTT